MMKMNMQTHKQNNQKNVFKKLNWFIEKRIV